MDQPSTSQACFENSSYRNQTISLGKNSTGIGRPVSRQRHVFTGASFLCALLLLISGGAATNLDTVIAEAPPTISAYVGKIFTLDKKDWIVETLPKWLNTEANSSQPAAFIGIPQLDDLGHYAMVNKQGDLQTIEVLEERSNECGNGIKTSWIEILHNTDNLEDLSISDQIRWVNRTYEQLRSALKELENTRDDYRLFKLGYLTRYRNADETISEDFEVSAEVDDKRAVLALNISCGELTQYATDVISAIADSSAIFRVVSGELNKNRATIRTTTSAPHKEVRTTRQIIDNRPVAFNQLTAFQCMRGTLCRLDIGENTFIDAEDGSTSQLRLSVHAIDAVETAPVAADFLVAIQRSTYLEGVPLVAGSFRFRIEARDGLNQTASLPFQVNVEEVPETNHAFLMTLDSTLEKFNKRRAETLRDFVYQLGAALTTGDRNIASSKSVRVDSLEETGPSQVTIRWSNATLSRRDCPARALNETRAQMSAGKAFERVRHEFRRAMGAQFYVKKVSLELSGVCVLTAATRTKLLDGLRMRATTIETTGSGYGGVDAAPSPTINTLAIPLILMAVAALFVALLTAFYCIHARGRQHRKKKQQQKSQFITKGGMPIVFPQEVPQDEDDDDVGAGVTTPMLVDREQPPLDPSLRMTLHENALYRPPPTAQATLRQVVAPSQTPASANPTSTFGSSVQNLVRQSNLSNAQGSRTATPRGAIAIGQRSPPPYTAVI